MHRKSLIKVLTEAGKGSRRGIAEAIKQGKVSVNGETATSFNHAIDPVKDKISINGKTVDVKSEKTICLMLNKPSDTLSTVSDERGRRTVLDILPEKYRHTRLYPVGRLDKDTTGLLLLTNDGDLTYRLTHPKFEYEKEYLAAIKGSLKKEEKQQLQRGILLEDGVTSPAKIREVSLTPFNYSVTIHEGRKRQVRRMFERLRYKVIALKRIRLGQLSLGDLKEGEVRLLSAKETKLLFNDNSLKS